LFSTINIIFKIAFFINIFLLSIGTWYSIYDLAFLSIFNMILLSPAFVKERDESK